MVVVMALLLEGMVARVGFVDAPIDDAGQEDVQQSPP